jgi:hypothetical protein
MKDIIDQAVNDILKSGAQSVKIPMCPLSELVEKFKKHGYKWRELSGNELNGWEVDFWYYFDKKGHKSICFSGGLYRGDFKLTEDNEE